MLICNTCVRLYLAKIHARSEATAIYVARAYLLQEFDKNDFQFTLVAFPIDVCFSCKISFPADRTVERTHI